ncbi:alpha/beta hydrolase family protein [Thalassoroseus pseudoceratinae]|uniref:alpha/beta hydrolase family protein n=1 Tax=Thalassoroseus pseudoceratinae TaxID=2713176 RepID=UPI0014204508|nr:acetylhydrolase [Thalassoroseus pseudoceratinae]
MIGQFRSSLAIVVVALMTTVSYGQDNAIQELRLEPVDRLRDRTVPIKVYHSNSERPQPVILFSHGLGGSRENNPYLGNYWAANGYVAVFMQHPGSDDDVWKSAKLGKRFQALKAAASTQTALLRFADIPFVIDQLEIWNAKSGHPLNGKLDLEHIGMSGHSYGAVTTLAVAGRKFPFNQNFAETRIDAFLAMSPQPGKGTQTAKTFGHLTQPILCMTGTKDGSPIDPTLKPATRREVYTSLPAGDKYQLVLHDAEHSAFGEGGRLLRRRQHPEHHPAIQQISLHFWNAYLKDNAKSRKWLQSNQPITTTKLDEQDIWEWK